MHTTYYVILAISTALFAGMGLAGMWFIQKQFAILDNPNGRSNHASPVPTGFGFAFMLMALGFLLVANAPGAILWPALLLLIVSFVDDIRHLSARTRFGFQLIAVIIALGALKQPVFQGLLPFWLDQIVTGLLWVWFINLYNFMDGIDEITITETVSIAAGLALLGMFVGDVQRHIAIDAVIIIAAVAVFYPLNRHPARAFMGDSGSVTLGLLVGYLLLTLAAGGHWQAALILPAYYISDATLTLAKRTLAGEKIWQAHSQHYYQRMVRAGYTHNVVTRQIMTLNLFLIALALTSSVQGAIAYGALAIAYVASFALIWTFARRSGTQAVAHVEAA